MDFSFNNWFYNCNLNMNIEERIIKYKERKIFEVDYINLAFFHLFLTQQ